MHNLLASLKPNELEGITQICVLDAETLKIDLEIKSDKPNLRESLKQQGYRVIQMQTSYGRNIDEDYLRWFIAINNKEGLLLIVREED